MKKLFALVLIAMCFMGCSTASMIGRQVATQSTTEFQAWNKILTDKLAALPVDQIKPFFLYFIEVVGYDKQRLPVECNDILRDIATILNSKDAAAFTQDDKATLIGKWDRFWIVMFESAADTLIKSVESKVSIL